MQEALQHYHVDQERYIPRRELTGSQLITVLDDFEVLPEMLRNPWTGKAWALDGEEPDHLRNQTDEAFETYALQVVDATNGQVVMELDSVNATSLK